MRNTSQASIDPATPLLFSPLSLRSVRLKNRIVVAPMCQYRSVAGGPTDWHLVHLGKFAVGGAGIVFTEETAVEERGRKTYACAGLYNDDHVKSYRRITDFIRSQGAVPAVQLGHAGRQASCHGAELGWKPLTEEDARAGLPPWQGVAPSPVAWCPDASVPHELSHADIKDMLAIWKESTLRAVDSGFDICEIHGGHGYLLHQFLSPLANKRTDAYGGDRSGRMRFVLEVTEAVRSVWPADKPLFFRMSVVDGRGGQWFVEDSIALAAELREIGVDLIDCSSGGMNGDGVFPPVPRVPEFQVEYSKALRHGARMPTLAVGLITSPRRAEAILQAGEADLIAIARGAIWDPNWPAHAAAELGKHEPYAVLPGDMAFRLRDRDSHRDSYSYGTKVDIPLSPDRSIPYSWPERGEYWPPVRE